MATSSPSPAREAYLTYSSNIIAIQFNAIYEDFSSNKNVYMAYYDLLEPYK